MMGSNMFAHMVPLSSSIEPKSDNVTLVLDASACATYCPAMSLVFVC